MQPRRRASRSEAPPQDRPRARQTVLQMGDPEGADPEEGGPASSDPEDYEARRDAARQRRRRQQQHSGLAEEEAGGGRKRQKKQPQQQGTKKKKKGKSGGAAGAGEGEPQVGLDRDMTLLADNASLGKLWGSLGRASALSVGVMCVDGATSSQYCSSLRYRCLHAVWWPGPIQSYN